MAVISHPPRRPVVTMAVRAWSHLMPLVRGTVQPADFDLRLDLRDHTPDRAAEPGLDCAETSFSRYVLGRSGGDDRWVGLPAFVMRGFRHRCFLVPKDSELTALEDLRGCSVGVTGWPDSGNTWARAVLRRAGVGLDEVKWTVAPLAGGTLTPDRVGAALPANVRVAEPGTSLLGSVDSASLDAIVAPFVESAIGTTDRALRHLIGDYRSAEEDYHKVAGFVPGIHLVALRREIAEAYPWLAAALVDTLEESKRVWQAERRLYADTTPWMLDDLQRTDAVFAGDWMPYGVSPNSAMVESFCAELTAQGLSSSTVDPSVVFDAYEELSRNASNKEESNT